jgi:tetratricopeptide (TPR) repeat protein
LAECYALGYWGFWEIEEDRAVSMSAGYAEKSVLADPGSAYAHSQLAAALFRQLRVRDAEAEFEKALAIRPENAEAHHAYAVFLDDTRRAESGIQEIKRAIDLEPLSLAYKTDLGMSYFFAKRYADAIAVYESVLKLDPGYVEAHEYLASMYVYQARWEQARAEYAAIDRLRRTHGRDDALSPLRIITEQKTGEQKKAQAAMDAILSAPSSQHSYSLAQVYAESGRDEEALRYLRQVVSGHSLAMFPIPDDPLLAALHGTPEFESISRQVLNAISWSPEENPSRPTIALARPLIGVR